MRKGQVNLKDQKIRKKETDRKPMRTHVIHAAILFVVFVVAVVVFEYMTSRGNDDLMADIGNASLPRVYFTVDGYGVNALNAYAEEMDITTMRDAVTPVVGQKVTVNIEAEETKVSSVEYAVYTMDGEQVLIEDKINEVKDQVEIPLARELTSRERMLKLTLHADGKSIYYYTRIADAADCNLTDCMDYIYDFHENALKKVENVGIGVALEQDDPDGDTSFSHVTIHSSFDQVTWGDLEPQVTGRERWKITEMTPSYLSVLLEYDVSCVGEENETDLYAVKEFFKVRKSSGQVSLSNYDRTMEQIFDGSKKVLSEKGVLLGITDPDVSYVVSGDREIVTFVQADEIWNYDREQDQLSQLFSFRDAENADVRNKVSDHSVQILYVDQKGNATFSVSGYMNRGNHEGYVGVAVYYYDIETNSIEEKAFVSSSKSAAVAQEELNSLIYYNPKTNVIYMLTGGSLHEIDIELNQDEVLIEGLEERQYAASDDGKWLAYQTGETLTESTEVTVKNLYDESEYTVTSGKDECILPLGFVGNDFVYGLAKQSDIGKTLSGEMAVPMHQIEICTEKEEVIKTYEGGKYYILDAEIADGMITLDRAQKEGNTYTSAKADYISSNQEKEESNIMLDSYVTELKETQMRLTYVDGIRDKTPKVLKPKQVVQDEPALPTFGDDVEETGYYVYGLGELQGICETAGEAIQLADSVSGVVVTTDGQCVWERGNRYLVFTLTGAEGTLNRLQNELKSGTGAVEAVQKVTDGEVLELAGCTTEQVLYLINQGTPVVGVRAGASAIILTGYDETHVRYLDTESGESKTATQDEMDVMLRSSGRMYIGYLPKVSE